ncbi:hypothetical protein GCM10027440_03480 [Nocardiopsis coralliicola]
MARVLRCDLVGECVDIGHCFFGDVEVHLDQSVLDCGEEREILAGSAPADSDRELPRGELFRLLGAEPVEDDPPDLEPCAGEELVGPGAGAEEYLAGFDDALVGVDRDPVVGFLDSQAPRGGTDLCTVLSRKGGCRLDGCFRMEKSARRVVDYDFVVAHSVLREAVTCFACGEDLMGQIMLLRAVQDGRDVWFLRGTDRQGAAGYEQFAS